MRTLLIIGVVFVAGWIFVEFFLPRIIKRKKTGDNPFVVRDQDFDQFISYFMPAEWDEYLKTEIGSKETGRKKMAELRKDFFKKYPDYYEQIDKRFIKNYFG